MIVLKIISFGVLFLRTYQEKEILFTGRSWTARRMDDLLLFPHQSPRTYTQIPPFVIQPHSP